MQDQAYYQKPRQPLSYQAARACLFAPAIAFGMNIILSSAVKDDRWVALTVSLLTITLYLIGFICSIIGITGAIQRLTGNEEGGGVGMLIVSLLGFLINLGLLFVMGMVLLALFQTRGAANQPVPKPVITPPATFQEFPEGLQREHVTHSYIKGNSEDKELDIFFFVEDLGGTIGKGSSLKDVVKSYPNTTLLNDTWKNIPVEVARVEESVQEIPWVTYNAQLPTLPSAIQITVCGPMEREEEIKSHLQEILANGVEGKSNWE